MGSAEQAILRPSDSGSSLKCAASNFLRRDHSDSGSKTSDREGITSTKEGETPRDGVAQVREKVLNMGQVKERVK
jgi:hypothetical protein